MDSFAYDHGMPCLNPSCKSHGKPHPNCKCYSHNAEGGEISFCSKNRPHDRSCEYFAEGGMSGQEVPESDILESSTPVAQSSMVGQEVPPEDQPTDYTTPGQQLKTVAEGLGQGIAGPLATLAETKLMGVDPKDIAARQEANPIEHGVSQAVALAGSMMTGIGEAGVLAKVVPEVEAFGKLGSAIFKGAIESGLYQGGDEVTKGMLGQGDPEAPVSSALAHMGAAALLGGVGSGVFNVIGRGSQSGLQALENAKVGTRAESVLAGMGAAAKAHGEGIPAEEAEEYVLKNL